MTDFEDKRTAPLFGDGAGAIVLGANGAGSVGPVILAHDGTMSEAITCDYFDRKLRMDGHETFKAAVRVLCESTEQACRESGRTFDDIDLFVYHQANGRILEGIAERLQIPQEKVVNYIGETANTSSASIPLSLSLARSDGNLHAGDTVLVSAVGAGFVWGACIIEWGAQ
jgi:3-oxoacyl-[acyl-carrier-protein] synthase III